MTQLKKIAEKLGRPVRVLHIGNIANNAWNNAKLLQSRYLENHVLCNDYYHVMGSPEWEEGGLIGEVDATYPDWEAIEVKGFKRPAWFVQGPMWAALEYLAQKNGLPANRLKLGFADLQRERRSARYEAMSIRAKRNLLAFHRESHVWRERFQAATATYPYNYPQRDIWVPFDEKVGQLVSEFRSTFPNAVSALSSEDLEPWRSIYEPLSALLSCYDLVEGYATQNVVPLICGNAPFVSYSHGTVRDIGPSVSDTATSRLALLAYHKSQETIITNTDCGLIAKNLGITPFRFVPHVIDQKYYESTQSKRSEKPSRCYVYCPSRQDWEAKGSDIAIRSFAAIAKEYPEMDLWVARWGKDLERSRALIADLGIQSRVKEISVLPIRDLITATRNAAALIDQFHLGVFGGIGPTALACGTPLVTRFDHKHSAWCMSKPPVFTADNLESAIVALRSALSADRVEHQAEQNKWMNQNYNYLNVVAEHEEIYSSVLDPKKKS